MKIRAIAWSTFGSLVRNKVIILFAAIFLCLLLLLMTPLSAMRRTGEAGESYVLGFVALMMSIVSGFGSLLAAWSSADAVAGEMKSGTILSVLARPVRRWEFLLGKYLGVQLLMLVYTVFMLGTSYALAAIGGQTIHAAPWILIVYPMLRYSIYSALAVLLVTVMHPVLVFAAVLITSLFTSLLAPGANSGFITGRIWMPLYAVLPSFDLLSESQYLGMNQASLKPIPWTNHATALAYGLDYALVLFLLAVWSFRGRALTRN
jgi:ABC-type transport system involved in multi-copper enzyme maturation permease subunit